MLFFPSTEVDSSSVISSLIVFDDCSEKNLPVPKIDEFTDEASIRPAEPNSSIVGKSDNF